MYNKINKLLRVVDVGAWITALVYFAYVLCSPGLYLQFILYLLILLACTCLLVKVHKSNKEKLSKYTEDELRRCRYKSTYRKMKIIFFKEDVVWKHLLDLDKQTSY